jgi:hypothetical protein
MPRCAPLGKRGVMIQQRKQSHDEEKSRPRRIDNDASCSLGTCICARGRILHAELERCDRPLRPASQTRLHDAEGRARCAPLSWRTEIERLTFFRVSCRVALAAHAVAPNDRHHDSPHISNSPAGFPESCGGYSSDGAAIGRALFRRRDKSSNSSPRQEQNPQRLLRFIGKLLCMGLILRIFSTVTR